MYQRAGQNEGEREETKEEIKKKRVEEAQSVYKQSPGSISIPAW